MTHWVNDLALSVSLLWFGTLAWELLHVAGVAKKRKKKCVGEEEYTI